MQNDDQCEKHRGKETPQEALLVVYCRWDRCSHAHRSGTFRRREEWPELSGGNVSAEFLSARLV